MYKIKLNYFVHVLLLLSFIVLVITSIVLLFFFPNGRQSGFELFLGIAKIYWSLAHRVSGIAMIILSVIHFILHFNVFTNITKARFVKKQN